MSGEPYIHARLSPHCVRCSASRLQTQHMYQNMIHCITQVTPRKRSQTSVRPQTKALRPGRWVELDGTKASKLKYIILPTNRHAPRDPQKVIQTCTNASTYASQTHRTRTRTNRASNPLPTHPKRASEGSDGARYDTTSCNANLTQASAPPHRHTHMSCCSIFAAFSTCEQP